MCGLHHSQLLRTVTSEPGQLKSEKKSTKKSTKKPLTPEESLLQAYLTMIRINPTILEQKVEEKRLRDFQWIEASSGDFWSREGWSNSCLNGLSHVEAFVAAGKENLRCIAPFLWTLFRWRFSLAVAQNHGIPWFSTGRRLFEANPVLWLYALSHAEALVAAGEEN